MTPFSVVCLIYNNSFRRLPAYYVQCFTVIPSRDCNLSIDLRVRVRFVILILLISLLSYAATDGFCNADENM